jgi:hypothetical protein
MANKIITIKEDELSEIGENVMSTVDKASNCLVLVIDLAREIGESSSGKMMGIGSSGGFITVPGTKAKMNLYIGKKTA